MIERARLANLWAETAPPGPACPPLVGETRADALVVGGGIAGLSCALHAAEAGASVVLLEQHAIGWGASGRNGGQVIPLLKREPDDIKATVGAEPGERACRLIGGSAGLVFDLARRHGIACDPVPGGWVQLAYNAATERLVAERASTWSPYLGEVALLDAGEAAEATGASGYQGGWRVATAGRLQPLAYTQGLAAAAMRAGARVHAGSEVREIRRHGGGWRLATAQGVAVADRLVLATNSYGRGLWPGLERSFVPVHTAQAATEPLPCPARATLLRGCAAAADTHPLLRYFRLDHEGRLLMGGRGALRPMTRPAQAAHLAGYVDQLFPQLRGKVRFSHVWDGAVAVTTDHLPHLMDLDHGAFALAGCNGRGVALQTALGRELARLATGARADEIAFFFSPLKPVPLHAAHTVYVQAYTLWHELKDRLGRTAA